MGSGTRPGRPGARRTFRLLSRTGRQLLEEPLGRHVMLVVPKTVAPERQPMTAHRDDATPGRTPGRVAGARKGVFTVYVLALEIGHRSEAIPEALAYRTLDRTAL